MTHDYPVVKAVKSEEDGTFMARNVPRRDLFVTAGKEGYAFYVTGYGPGYTFTRHVFVQYREGVPSPDIRIVLHPGGVISGRVVDDSGKPLPGANVNFIISGSADWPWWRTNVPTDQDGRFTCGILAPGSYYVGASKEGYVFLPGPDHRVEPGETNLLLRLKKELVARGKVIFADTGKPAADAIVNDTARTDDEGRFSIGIHPEFTTRLKATWYGMASDGWVKVDPSTDDISNIVIKLVKAASISGKVLDQDTGKLIKGIVVCVSPGGASDNQMMCDDGAFAFRDIMPGDTYLYESSEEYYVDSGNPSSGAGVRVHLEPGQNLENFEMLLRHAYPYRISGTVVDSANNPIEGVTVIPIAGTAAASKPQSVPTGADGRFSLEGSYYYEIDGLLLNHQEYSHTRYSFERLGEHLVTENLVIVIEKGGSIEGNVADSRKGPLPRVEVTLGYDYEEGPTLLAGPLKTAFTDEAGHYRIEHVGPGNYRVYAEVGENHPKSPLARMAANETITGVDIEVNSSGRISGKITDRKGSPLEGLVVTVSATQYATPIAQQEDGTRRDVLIRRSRRGRDPLAESAQELPPRQFRPCGEGERQGKQGERGLSSRVEGAWVDPHSSPAGRR